MTAPAPVVHGRSCPLEGTDPSTTTLERLAAFARDAADVGAVGRRR